MLDQTSLGNRFLMQEFNFTPRCFPAFESPHTPDRRLFLGRSVQGRGHRRVSWQLDPFGHSATQAVLLTAGLGADAMFFGRVDYQDRDARRARGAMEYVWRASPTLGASAQIFAGANLGGSYGPPDGLCWDQAQCEGHTEGAAPIIDSSECNIFEPNNVRNPGLRFIGCE
jgi:alpha-mannosidase